ncbi:MAG: substrate-binding domain-containing protein, partial [Pseudomonadota bacterium]
RNFQMQFLRPLLVDGRYRVALRSGNTEILLEALTTLSLDVVLTTQVPQGSSAQTPFAARRIAEQPVGIHGTPARLQSRTLSDLLQDQPLILPTDPTIRLGFQALVDQLGVQPRILADVDDMAMVRLLAREGVGLAIAPSVVVADEVAAGLLATSPFDLGLSETFYAVTLPRRFAHPALANLLHGRLGSADNDAPVRD